MMPLAASGIEITIGAIVFAIYWIYKLASGAANSAPKPPPMPPQPGNRQGSIRESQERHGNETEEERTRKFLEALGLPASSLQPKTASEAMRGGTASMSRPGKVPPVPPFVPETMRGGRGSIPHGVPDPFLPSQSQVEQAQRELFSKLPREERKRREAQEKERWKPAPLREPAPKPYDGAIERIHFAELKTPEVPEFHTRTSDVSAIPFELADSVAGKLYMKLGTVRQEELLALARSPKALRQAILLREILGPPRSLQSDFATPNLAPL
jgi:hypothetical protein